MAIQDFARDVWCLFGIPVDNMSLDDVLAALPVAARRDGQTFLSTPNLNYLAAAWRDPEFRESLIDSDLSVADGMPLIWAGRALGLPLRERVAGSDFMQRLLETNAVDPLTIFFFGGEPCAAESACRAINARPASGLRAVGCIFPGFGSVEDMSTEQHFIEINRHNPDILSVSVGAHKAQIWLQRNRSRLNAKIVSHLGAVVNFFAGSVRRAPPWMRKSGLEWVWRISQEPSLWRRYWQDGALMMRLFVSRSLPFIAWSYYQRWFRTEGGYGAHCVLERSGDECVLQLSGACVAAHVDNCLTVFKDAAALQSRCRIDFSQVTDLDARFIGLILMLRKNLGPRRLQIGPVNALVRRILVWNCADYLLEDTCD